MFLVYKKMKLGGLMSVFKDVTLIMVTYVALWKL